MDEIKQPEKGWCFVAYSPTRAGLAANHHLFGDRFARVGGQDCRGSFVDRLTKMVHFFPCTKEIATTEYARLFINQVFRLHGMPEVIISDRDPQFVSKF